VIDEPGWVPTHAAVDVPFVVQLKNKRVAGLAAANGFGLRYPFAHILDQQRAGANRFGGECSKPVNWGRSKFQTFEWLHSLWKNT
jgi:hypothetical protein